MMSGCFRFADFELDLAAYVVRRRGERVRLEKVPMEVLILLVRAAGALVRRDEIHAALWGAHVFVERDSAINTAVRKIRHALDDDAAQPRFVETVVGQGYRFVAPVEEVLFGGVRPKPPDVVGPVRRMFPSYAMTHGADEFILQPGVTLLGRDPDVGVYIEHPSVSRHHARISIEAGEVILEDLQSRNGTFVRGRRIEGPTEIHHGDIVGLGPITLSFHVLAAPPSTRPVSAS